VFSFFAGSKANSTFLSHHAKENSELCEVGFGKTHYDKCWTCGCGINECYPGSTPKENNITFDLTNFSFLFIQPKITQEVEYVKSEAKIVYLLECLQKTQPPVLIFAEKKQDVDNVHEYLLLKGVEAVAIHGGKGELFKCNELEIIFTLYFCLIDQEERSKGVESFRSGKKDVLVATDVASKGLDFPNIQHVINYDMPDDIENYGKLIPFKYLILNITFE
jgi:superfamily II DNA or RNA helicase